MSLPPRLAVKLNETLGPDAAGDLVNYMDETRAEHAELRADLAELRQEVRAVELRLTSQITLQFATQTEAIQGKLDLLQGKLELLADRVHSVDKRIDQKHAHLLTWSFLFWVGAVAAIATLAGVLRS